MCDREDGGALEQLAAARVLLLDKTGTLTTGQPSVADVVTSGAFTADEVLAWPPRSTRSHRTCWPHRSCRRPGSAGWRCNCPRM
ncbi:MAG TPA: hypothetical protein VK925_08920 [Jiangellaceae bacterium]|nr:hypothetical protein [Jiangellaceae bacterium]